MSRILHPEEAYSYTESELENLLWHYLAKCPREKCQELHVQYPCGRYRLDAMIVFDGRKVGIEVDGKAFHDKTRDYYRDKEIILGGHVHEIVRVPYAAIHFYGRATFACLDEWHPGLFPFGRLDTSVYSLEEAREAMDAIRNRYDDESLVSEELKHLSDNTEVFVVCGRSMGLAMSMEAWVKRFDVTPITRLSIENFQRS